MLLKRPQMDPNVLLLREERCGAGESHAGKLGKGQLPVRFWSKNAISCILTARKRSTRNRATRRWPCVAIEMVGAVRAVGARVMPTPTPSC